MLGSDSCPQMSCADTACWPVVLDVICISDAFQITGWCVTACHTMTPRTVHFISILMIESKHYTLLTSPTGNLCFIPRDIRWYPLSHGAGLRKFLGELQPFLLESPAHLGCLPERPPTGAHWCPLMATCPRLPSVPCFCLLEELWTRFLTRSDLAISGPLPPSPSSSTQQ